MENQNKEKKSGLLNKIAVPAIICLCLCGIVAFITYKAAAAKNNFLDKARVKDQTTLDVVTLEEVLKPASELVSLKYYYTNSDIYEKSKSAFGFKIPFTTEKTVFTYSGVISAGIDLSDAKFEIDNEAKTITVNMPESAILSHVIDEDSFQFYDVSSSVFTNVGLDDYTQLMQEMKVKQEEKLLANSEFMESANQNARDVLKGFLSTAESTKDYTFIFH